MDTLPAIRVVSTLMSRLDADSRSPLAERSALALRRRSRSAGIAPTSTPSQERVARRSSASISPTPSIHWPLPLAVSRPARSTSAPPGNSADVCRIVTTPFSSLRRALALRMTPLRQVSAPIVRSRAASIFVGISRRMSSVIDCGVARASALPGCPAPSEPAASAVCGSLPEPADPAGLGLPSSGRKRSRSMRLRSISAANRGTSPPCQESVPFAWLSPSRTWSSRAEMVSARTLNSPLAENSLPSGAAGSDPRSTASAFRRAPKSAASLRTLPSNAGIPSMPLRMPSNSALPRSPPNVASNETGRVRSSPTVPVAS